MAANVTVKSRAFTDPRVELLGELAGYNRYEALGRLTHLWGVCTDLESYEVSEAVIRGCLGPLGVESVLAADLAERSEVGIRVRGTIGTIEWLGNKRRAGASGGKRSGESKRRRSKGKAQAKQDESTEQAKPNPQVLRDPVTQVSLPSTQGDCSTASPKTDHQLFIDAFQGLYVAANGVKPSWNGKTGSMVQGLLKAHGLNESLRRARIMFESPPVFISTNDLPTLVQHFDKFAKPASGGRGPPKDRAQELWELADRMEQERGKS